MVGDEALILGVWCICQYSSSRHDEHEEASEFGNGGLPWVKSIGLHLQVPTSWKHNTGLVSASMGYLFVGMVAKPKVFKLDLLLSFERVGNREFWPGKRIFNVREIGSLRFVGFRKN